MLLENITQKSLSLEYNSHWLEYLFIFLNLYELFKKKKKYYILEL